MSDTGSELKSAEEITDLHGTDEAYVTRPTTQLDLERRQAIEDGEPIPDVGEAREMVVEGNDTSGFIGVSPEYQNYANETEAALPAEDGPEVRIEDRTREFLDAPKAGVVSADDNQAEEPYPPGSTGTDPTEPPREPDPTGTNDSGDGGTGTNDGGTGTNDGGTGTNDGGTPLFGPTGP